MRWQRWQDDSRNRYRERSFFSRHQGGDTFKAEEENISDGDNSDVPVTAYSRCETSCHPVTAVTMGAKIAGHLLLSFLFSLAQWVLLLTITLSFTGWKRKRDPCSQPRKMRYERRYYQAGKHSVHVIQRAYRRFMTAKTWVCTSEKTEARKTQKQRKYAPTDFSAG